MFKRDPQKDAERAARFAAKRQELDAKRQRKDELKAWRQAHPAETTLNSAAMLKAWPSSKGGLTSLGPILGGHAEFVDVGAHKGWTATRLVAGVATAGASLAAGRRNKGAAVLNVTFGNGAAKTYNVAPEPALLRAANQYVTAFNALAQQLAAEAQAAGYPPPGAQQQGSLAPNQHWSSPPPSPMPPVPSTASVADELAKLATLRDQGVLSAEEFETQKARLLRG